MDRRDWLKLGIGATLSNLAYAVPALANGGGPKRFGALAPDGAQFIQNQHARRFHEVFRPLKGIARAKRKNTFLWRYLQKQIGEIEPHWQGRDPEDGTEGEGDCIGHAAAMCVDTLTAVQKHMLRRRTKWIAKAAVEPIYWGSRVEIGGNVMPLGGSRGSWAAEWLNKYGVLHRIPYAVGDDSADFSDYSPGKSRRRRRAGVPDWLEAIAKKSPIEEITNVKTGEEALDAICSGQPVLMCSTYKFGDTRDKDGFAYAYTSNAERWKWNGKPNHQWFHAMALTAALVEGPRIGGGIQNSHGQWNDGPSPFGMPVGAFFTDLAVLDLMVKDWFDCWALSAYKGSEAKRMKHKLYRS